VDSTGTSSTDASTSATDTGRSPITCEIAADEVQCAAARDGEATGSDLPCLWVLLVRTSVVDDACSFEVVDGKCLAPTSGDTGCGGYDAACGYEATYRVDDEGALLVARIADACTYYWGEWDLGFERAECQALDTTGTGTDTGAAIDPEAIACMCACADDYPD
jgi:hypothetical protein